MVVVRRYRKSLHILRFLGVRSGSLSRRIWPEFRGVLSPNCHRAPANIGQLPRRARRPCSAPRLSTLGFVRVRAPRQSFVKGNDAGKVRGLSRHRALGARQLPRTQGRAPSADRTRPSTLSPGSSLCLLHSRAEDRLATATNETYEPLYPFSKSFSARPASRCAARVRSASKSALFQA